MGSLMTATGGIDISGNTSATVIDLGALVSVWQH